WFCSLLGLLFTLGAGLLLYGMHTRNEPLFLLVLIPMPILIALGYHFGYLGNDIGFFIAVLGMMWPMITYRPVSRYYKRRHLFCLNGDVCEAAPDVAVHAFAPAAEIIGHKDTVIG